MPYAPNPIHWIGSSLTPIPKNLRHDDQTRNTLDGLQEALKAEEPRGGVLYGNPGTGKSTALTIFAKPFLEIPLPTITHRVRHPWLDRVALWAQASEFIEDTKQEIALSQRSDFTDFSDAFSATGIARRVKYLFIDDLGTESQTEYNRTTMETLIDSRYRDREKKVTWFTTNLNIPELNERYSNRTVSRLCEMCDLIEWHGNDRRISSLIERSRA